MQRWTKGYWLQNRTTHTIVVEKRVRVASAIQLDSLPMNFSCNSQAEFTYYMRAREGEMFDQRIFNTNSIYYSINRRSLSRGYHVISIQLNT